MFYLLRVYAYWLIIFSQSCQRPFRPFTIFLGFTVLYELLWMFIDTKICQMNEPFSDVFSFDIVLIGGESGKAFFEHVNS